MQGSKFKQFNSKVTFMTIVLGDFLKGASQVESEQDKLGIWLFAMLEKLGPDSVLLLNVSSDYDNWSYRKEFERYVKKYPRKERLIIMPNMSHFLALYVKFKTDD